MIGGSSVVDIDSPQAFGNIQLHKDECVNGYASSLTTSMITAPP